MQLDLILNNYIVEDRGYATPCWIYQGMINSEGYAQIHPEARTYILLHREAYKLKFGRYPLTTDHLCRVRCCINPDHLESVTRGINTLRGDTITGNNSRKTHCKNGHQLKSRVRNTRNGQVSRYCPICQYVKQKARI